MYSTVIFDLDGTLFDTSEGIKKSILHTIQACKLKPLTEDKLTEFVGYSPLPAAFEHFCSTGSKTGICVETYRDFYKNEGFKFSKIYKNVIELLEYLRTNGCKTGVATFKRQDYTDKMLDYFKMTKYFDAICGADKENKLTKADILKNCLGLLNAAPKNAVMVGDSLSDGSAANTNNAGFIGVTYGFGFKTPDEITKFSPVFCAGTVGELINYFKTEPRTKL